MRTRARAATDEGGREGEFVRHNDVRASLGFDWWKLAISKGSSTSSSALRTPFVFGIRWVGNDAQRGMKERDVIGRNLCR